MYNIYTYIHIKLQTKIQITQQNNKFKLKNTEQKK